MLPVAGPNTVEWGEIRDPAFYIVVTCPVSRMVSPMDDAYVYNCRTLQLSCFCPAYSQKNPSIVDPLVCDAFQTIDTALPALPRLTTLRLRVQYIDVHGLSWNTVRTILSLPHLRHVHIDGLYICPELLDGDNLDPTTATTPLSTFHYVMPHYRQPWSFPSESIVLDFLIRKLHTSLESLVLPVESAPLQTISSLHWPRLREFTLRGERWSDHSTPVVTLLSSMPSLHSLALELSEPKNAVPGVVWPKGLTAALPWPNLDTLRLSHPDPADEIYNNLPPSLRALSLRSWPHKCIEIYDENRAYLPPSWYRGHKRRWWNCPLLTPRALAQVLQKCNFSLLLTLELEYRVDAREPELLRAIAARLPHLTTLEVHRFRSEGKFHVAVVSWHISYTLCLVIHLSNTLCHVGTGPVDRLCGSSGTARIPPHTQTSSRF